MKTGWGVRGSGDRAGWLGKGLGVLIVACLLSACGVSVPSDPDGSFDRIQGGVLRAGASPDGGLVLFERGEATGSLVELVQGFAERHDAEVAWTLGSEESLVRAIEEGALDIAVGGITAETPWAERVGSTRGYADVPGSDGREIVLLTVQGENRLLFELEAFLDEELEG